MIISFWLASPTAELAAHPPLSHLSPSFAFSSTPTLSLSLSRSLPQDCLILSLEVLSYPLDRNKLKSKVAPLNILCLMLTAAGEVTQSLRRASDWNSNEYCEERSQDVNVPNGDT